jgi:hypothetical protein
MRKNYFILALIISAVIISGCTQQSQNEAVSAVQTTSTQSQEESSTTAATSTSTFQEGPVTWYFDNRWKPTGNPPSCPDPLVFRTPVDIDKATSILYPGQYRGVQYKAHGGFRFDGSKNEDIIVRAPMDGYIVDASRYLEGGEVQYMFDIINPCGIMYRFDHLYTLSPKLAAIAEQLREPAEGDSRTTAVTPVFVQQGEVLATAVGLENNVFADWGLYDLRKENEASKDLAYREEHSDFPWFAFHALCWLNFLGAEDLAKVKALPGADSVSGTQSDYCK